MSAAPSHPYPATPSPPLRPRRHVPPSATVMELLDRAQASLLYASQADQVGERYVLAHLAGERGDRVLPAREADDLVRQAEAFIEVVQDALGVPRTFVRPDYLAPVTPLARHAGR